MFVTFLASLSLFAANEKANVLFIAVDDLNDWLGCHQTHQGTKTPNIDRLAECGVVFTNAHCQTALCGPSRDRMITGLPPSTTAIYDQLDNSQLDFLAPGREPPH
ncbi:MAG: sulfatase-like hydrolase/transferase [Haloferula sp.]